MARAGVIDWSMLITSEMKAAAAAVEHLAQAKADLTARNAKAVIQIARIQDRVDTIGFGIDIGEATEEDEAELAALSVTIKAWKTYKFALGKVTTQPTWYQAPIWPIEPPIPEIVAAPMLVTTESV
ncbi:phage tail protein [Pseudomonas monsensis]